MWHVCVNGQSCLCSTTVLLVVDHVSESTLQDLWLLTAETPAVCWMCCKSCFGKVARETVSSYSPGEAAQAVKGAPQTQTVKTNARTCFETMNRIREDRKECIGGNGTWRLRPHDYRIANAHAHAYAHAKAVPVASVLVVEAPKSDGLKVLFPFYGSLWACCRSPPRPTSRIPQGRLVPLFTSRGRLPLQFSDADI